MSSTKTLALRSKISTSRARTRNTASGRRGSCGRSGKFRASNTPVQRLVSTERRRTGIAKKTKSLPQNGRTQSRQASMNWNIKRFSWLSPATAI